MCTPRCDRRQVDDGSNLALNITGGLFDHPARHQLRQTQTVEQILLQHRLCRIIIDAKRIGHHHLPTGINQNINLIEMVDRRGKQVGHRQLFAKIPREVAHIALILGRAQFVDQTVFIHVDKHDIRALIGKVTANRTANAVCTSGDDRSLAFD